LLATSEGNGWAKGKNDELSFGNASEMINFPLIHVVGSNTEIEKGVFSEITSDVDIADKAIEVESTSGFTVGDTIVITKSASQGWIELLGMGQYGWNAPDYQLEHRRAIVNLEGNRLLLD